MDSKLAANVGEVKNGRETKKEYYNASCFQEVSKEEKI